VIVAGIIADEIRYAGMTLLGFKMEIAAILLFLLLVVLTPLCFFMVQLSQAGRTAKGLGGATLCISPCPEAGTGMSDQGSPLPHSASPLARPSLLGESAA
jgi:hypothetical protein